MGFLKFRRNARGILKSQMRPKIFWNLEACKRVFEMSNDYEKFFEISKEFKRVFEISNESEEYFEISNACGRVFFLNLEWERGFWNIECVWDFVFQISTRET